MKYFVLNESNEVSVKPSPAGKGDTVSLIKYVLSLGVAFAKINVPSPVFLIFFSDKLTALSTYLTTSLTELSAIVNSRSVPTLSFIISEFVFNLPVKLVLLADVKLYVTVPFDIDILLKSPASLSCKLVIFTLSFAELPILPTVKPEISVASIVNSYPFIFIVSVGLDSEPKLPISPVKLIFPDTLNSELMLVKVAVEKSPAKIASLAFVRLIITFALLVPVNVIPPVVREFVRE